MKNIFGESPESPFHISVAALLVNEKGEILTHHFKKEDLPRESEMKSDLYLVMRETIHEGEALEHAVHRGLMEEYGAKGEIIDYLGSIQSHFPCTKDHSIQIEKTVLYFYVSLESIDESKREAGAVESRSTLLWIDPQRLISILEEQAKKYSRSDLNDTKIITDFIRLHAK